MNITSVRGLFSLLWLSWRLLPADCIVDPSTVGAMQEGAESSGVTAPSSTARLILHAPQESEAAVLASLGMETSHKNETK